MPEKIIVSVRMDVLWIKYKKPTIKFILILI